MPTYAPELKDIDINSSAAELRSYTLAFVSFLLYVLITAASTEHEQLLRISTVTLPLLNINIPIVQFYLVSPLLILILHFHLLLQHFLFSQQYYSFDEALKIQYPDRTDRVRFMKNISGNLSLVHLLGGYQKTFVQILLVSIVAICLLIFPLFNLWFLQAKFLPFHNTDYTNWQCLMVVIDCLMLLALLPKILDKNDNAWQWWTSIISPIFLIRHVYFILIAICRLLYLLNRLFLSFLQRFFYQPRFAGFRFFIITISSNLTTTIHNLQLRYQAVLLIRIISVKHFLAIGLLFGFLASLFVLSVFISTLPQVIEIGDEKKLEKSEKIDNLLKYVNPIDLFNNDASLFTSMFISNMSLFINDREKWLVKDMPECKKEEGYSFIISAFNTCKMIIYGYSYDNRYALVLTAFLHEKNTDNEPFLFRNLSLSEKIITADEHLNHELENTLDKSSTLEKIAGVNLNNRDLRYANFSKTKLPKADLRKAVLQGVYLENANLQDVNLSSADLQSADLSNVELGDANLSNANLQYANLDRTNFQDADLSNANLQYANLDYTYFGNVNLSSVNLQDTYLHYVSLQGANLSGANFQGADLDYPELQGANLSGANFQGAGLKNAKLQGVNLSGANLQDANLEDANLQGVNLINANLQNANLIHANLRGANLNHTGLQSANLIGTDLSGTDLSNANLQGTNLSDANLQGAYLMSVIHGKYINPETKKFRSTSFPIDDEKKADIYCLTDDDKLPICKKYDEKNTRTLKKIIAYWINDLACFDQWIAQGIVNNLWNIYIKRVLSQDNLWKSYSVPLLNKKLTDKTCLGIQNLPDEIKQTIILANKPTNKN